MKPVELEIYFTGRSDAGGLKVPARPSSVFRLTPKGNCEMSQRALKIQRGIVSGLEKKNAGSSKRLSRPPLPVQHGRNPSQNWPRSGQNWKPRKPALLS